MAGCMYACMDVCLQRHVETRADITISSVPMVNRYMKRER